MGTGEEKTEKGGRGGYSSNVSESCILGEEGRNMCVCTSAKATSDGCRPAVSVTQMVLVRVALPVLLILRVPSALAFLKVGALSFIAVQLLP